MSLSTVVMICTRPASATPPTLKPITTQIAMIATYLPALLKQT